jgi:hypothetical protein
MDCMISDIACFDVSLKCIFLKFDHPIYENDTSPFEKGGSRGIFQVDSLLNPPWPPFFKGGNPFDFSMLDCSMKFKNDTLK